MAGGVCPVCQQAATNCCAGCHTVYYCSRDHQKQHWRAHKSSCRAKPYKICHSPVLGRYLTATRDLNPGDTIIKERPAVIGPKTISKPVCLGCNRHVTDATITCSSCSWPICSAKCERSPLHVDECKLMAERGYRAKITDVSRKDAAYCCITPLRCLLLKETDKTKWDSVSNLESHLDVRRNTPMYSIFKANIVGFFGQFPKLNEFDEETILRVCGILDTNCFEVCRSDSSVRVRGVYPTAAIMSHDCVPNTRHVFDDDNDLTMVVTAVVPIKQGDLITTTYTRALWETTKRREHLKSAKCFDCTCKRCADPTELGTYVGSIICSKCQNNNDGPHSKLLSTNPLDDKAQWMCEQCRFTVEGREIESMNNSIRKEISYLDKSSPKSLEMFLEKYENILHPTNCHVVEIKYALVQMYGKSRGYSLPELTDDQLERKAKLGTELLKLVDILDPGCSYLRGVLLLDQQAVLVDQAVRQYAARKQTNVEDKQSMMRSALKILEEANNILQSEPRMKETLEEHFIKIRKELRAK